MRLENEDQATEAPIQSPSLEQFVVGRLQEISHENKTSVSKPGSSPSSDYSAFVARATTDAIRDWNVKTGELCWPQGLTSLLGYDSSAENHISFWQKNIHSIDRARAFASISDALCRGDSHWSGEYRFRRAD